MRVKIWGSRGSLPAPHRPEAIKKRVRDAIEAFSKENLNLDQIDSFLDHLPPERLGGFGGNTPCIEVKTDQARAILDGGSGIRNLGYELMDGPCGKGEGEVHLFFTHFHWDHLIGLPFFTPMFVPGNTIHVYAVQNDLQNVFETIFKKPYFPVPLKDLGAKIKYHRLKPREPFALGDLTLTPYQLDHPDPCWGFRCESQGRVYSHCVDTECSRVSRTELGPDLPLYQGVDLMVFDAQYTLMETIEKINWGHAAASLGLDIAMREGIKRVYFMHHDPASSDEKIAQAKHQAERYFASQIKAARKSGKELFEVAWDYVVEGMELEV